jgi:hypothetical protein
VIYRFEENSKPGGSSATVFSKVMRFTVPVSCRSSLPYSYLARPSCRASTPSRDTVSRRCFRRCMRVSFTASRCSQVANVDSPAQVGVSSNLTHSSGVTASTWNQVTFGALHLLPWNNYFYGGLRSFLQSAEQGINLQTTLGGGIGRFLKSTNRASISVLGGFAWQNTSYKQSIVPIGTQNVAAGLIAGDVKLFWFNKTNLSLTATLLPAVSEPGRRPTCLAATTAPARASPDIWQQPSDCTHHRSIAKSARSGMAEDDLKKVALAERIEALA